MSVASPAGGKGYLRPFIGFSQPYHKQVYPAEKITAMWGGAASPAVERRDIAVKFHERSGARNASRTAMRGV
ncbi:hypothetical protein KCP75_19165 [Salmonella enterica subsp. enterica]|nr:hypothetical protein KCP75_19165 [Salmonella enterica subsp. enterica]